jgi:hypothetical protein
VGRGYVYAGFHPQPFTVWDADQNIQLDFAFVERGVVLDADGTLAPPSAQPATFDSTWHPDASDLGGREYMFIPHQGYTPTPKPNMTVDGAPLDSLAAPWHYSAWLRQTAEVAPGDVFRFSPSLVPGTANDSILFQTTPLIRGDVNLARSRMDRIRAVPNPYYNQSRYELNQFARVIRFINMPELATVRIFTLSGQLIRTLQKTNTSSSILEWDLLTTNQLPVASGVYIFHVDAPGVGSSFGRLAVFMEKERLNNF